MPGRVPGATGKSNLPAGRRVDLNHDGPAQLLAPGLTSTENGELASGVAMSNPIQ